jgi:DNA repair and recombination protein RAD52
MFNDEQKAALSAPLSRDAVKKRKGGGMDLSYIEGWWAIAEANRIFGFDGWTRETVDMLKCGEPEQVNGKWRVRFMCKVRITVGDIIREGTGYGSGIAGDLGDAYEGAIKEAETDAMKRAFMTFGNPFGLALYDKTQSAVSDTSQVVGQSPAPARKSAAQAKRDGDNETVRGILEGADTLEELDSRWRQVENEWLPILPLSWEDSVRDVYEKHRDKLKEKETA